jgi:hypothetical protein
MPETEEQIKDCNRRIFLNAQEIAELRKRVEDLEKIQNKETESKMENER